MEERGLSGFVVGREGFKIGFEDGGVCLGGGWVYWRDLRVVCF